MSPIHQRLAELWMTQKKRSLTKAEAHEWSLCLDANADYAYRAAKLYNLSCIATDTQDLSWLNDLFTELDKLEMKYLIKRPTPDNKNAG
jgi:hypothetical protein